MQPAELAHELVSRSQIEVVGVAEEDLRAVPSISEGSSVFTVAWVPTGMNAGVSTAP
jgi:hypothetical protein